MDGASPSASDSNPGTASLPYKTISAAVKARAGAGNTIVVEPATYREEVTVPAAGASGSPFAIQAAAAGTIVDGGDDFSSTSKWTPVSGNVYRTPVSWTPKQVFSDGARLTPSSASTASIPSRSFKYSSGYLYVNAGGGNPGAHELIVGRRSEAFTISGKPWVTVRGFTVRHQEDDAIVVSGSSSNTTISSNVISLGNAYGITLTSCSGVTVEGNTVSYCNDHGIHLSSASGSVIRGNESFGNARPSSRAANGIYLTGSSGNRLERNRLHDNQDSGVNIYNGSNNNICVLNVSWNNGDHGYDHLSSSGNVHIAEIAYHNYKDGFSIEGTSPKQQIYDCIAIDNGLTTSEFDLWVDSSSSSGFVSDFNIFWNSASGTYPVKYISTKYTSVAAYAAASGKDTHTAQANPRFVNAGAGDFHLLPRSPAIDDAISSVASWPATDGDGRARADDPATPNTGVGVITYGDRGAFEYIPSGTDTPPVVSAPATAGATENQPLVVNVTASDAEPITSLTVNLAGLPAGGDAVFTPNAENTAGTLTWTPKFTDAPGPYTVTFTASNTLLGSASTSIAVGNVDGAPVVTAPAAVGVAIGQQLTATVTASDPDGDAIETLTADLSGLPAGNNAQFAVDASHTSGTLTWTPTADDASDAPYAVTFTAANGLSGSSTTAITVGDQAPANLCGNPSFEADVSGWKSNGSSTLTRVTGGHAGSYCLEIKAPSNTTYGITDNPNWIASVPAAGARYHFTAWVRSGSSTGNGKIKIREFAGGTQQGASAYSAPVPLSPSWQQIVFDYTAQVAGSTLDLEVNDYPLAAGEMFQVDDITISVVPGAAPAPRVAAERLASPEVGAAFAARVSSNPVRDGGAIDIVTTRPGALEVQVFDIRGRKLPLSLDRAFVPAGRHEVPIRVRDERGNRLGAGVFFYRVRATEGERSGRFVVLE